jgi:hypothetical protein
MGFELQFRVKGSSLESKRVKSCITSFVSSVFAMIKKLIIVIAR